MFIDLILPISITMGLTTFALIARWYLLPHLRRLDLGAAATPILLFHTFRYVGLAFLIVGVTAEPLDSRFANPAAFGDLAAALLALAAAVAFRRRWSGAVPLAWVFNVVGLLDLLNAVVRGITFTPDGHLGATFFIPAVVVPALVVTHIVLFILLVQKRS